MALLQIIGLNKSYNKKKVIEDLSFELQSGEIMGLIGQDDFRFSKKRIW